MKQRIRDRSCGSWLIILMLFLGICGISFAQPRDRIQGWGDGEVTQQYVLWIRQAMDEGRWSDVSAALERASDFINVSSDVSYLIALNRSREGRNRFTVLDALDTAIELNRWTFYSERLALLFKAEQFIAMRRFANALDVLEQASRSTGTPADIMAADAAMLSLLAYRGLALNSGNPADLVRFRSQTLSTMDRFPRDPRPLFIFFGYARNRMPSSEYMGMWSDELPAGDLDLLELVIRRLPFLLETDPELAWIAAPFMRDTEAARRLVASYRAGGIPHIKNRDFYPSAGSLPAALNLGLIGDREAVEELFIGNPVIDKDVLIDVYYLLRSEEGRRFFSQKLHSFTGTIISDDDNDGYINSRTHFQAGKIRRYECDKNQENAFDLIVLFSPDGVPVSAEIPVTGHTSLAAVIWERYPFVKQVTLEKEIFSFRPADFSFAPVSFNVIGGSRNHSGLAYPILSDKVLTRRSLVSFCSSITRPSLEFDGAVERIYLERGIPRQAVETLNGVQISVTEFQNGLPVIQYVDLDLDGRMETIRRFRRPGTGFNETLFDYRSLLASSESDWTGDGRFKTGELYLPDGSVVPLMDMDGTGVMNNLGPNR